MKKKIKILKDKLLLKRLVAPEKKQLILGVPSKNEQEAYFKGNIVETGSEVAKWIDVQSNDIAVYDKYPEIIKIDDELYDLISVLNVKYVEHM